MTNNRPTRIYAGAGHRLQGADKGRHGGLFRRFVGDGEWELLTAGLPDNVEARAFAVHPHDHKVIYAGTQDGPYRTTRWRRPLAKGRVSRSRRRGVVDRFPTGESQDHVCGRGADRDLSQ